MLGLRLLTLDARIRFVPAQFTTSPLSPRTWPAPDHPWAPLGDLAPPGHRSPGWAWAPPGGLDDAADLLVDASRTLDRVRQDLSASLRSIHDQEIRNLEAR
ncbi:MAG: hypothetical protein IRY85_15880 [Micromonosporaceae bacterium]|nr:hypothetical protein [Micromonosporaceae bacterium]